MKQRTANGWNEDLVDVEDPAELFDPYPQLLNRMIKRNQQQEVVDPIAVREVIQPPDDDGDDVESPEWEIKENRKRRLDALQGDGLYRPVGSNDEVSVFTCQLCENTVDTRNELCPSCKFADGSESDSTPAPVAPVDNRFAEPTAPTEPATARYDEPGDATQAWTYTALGGTPTTIYEFEADADVDYDADIITFNTSAAWEITVREDPYYIWTYREVDYSEDDGWAYEDVEAIRDADEPDVPALHSTIWYYDGTQYASQTLAETAASNAHATWLAVEDEWAAYWNAYAEYQSDLLAWQEVEDAYDAAYAEYQIELSEWSSSNG